MSCASNSEAAFRKINSERVRALIIDEPWISAIPKAEKTREMRKRNCKISVPIALICKSSGHVVGGANLTDSRQPLATPETYAAAEDKHRIPPASQVSAFRDGWATPWVISARALPCPVPYRHPSGAVIWVTLDSDVADAVKA